MQPRFSFVLLVIAACGDDGNTPVDAGITVDARPDAVPDASADANLGMPLVGTWVKSPDAYTDQGYQSLTFRADGTVTIVTPNGTQNRAYVVPAPGRLRIIVGADFQETSFVTLNDQALFDAVLPQGQVTGVVGTWTTTLGFDTGLVTASLAIAADHTFTGMTMSASDGSTFSGTWAAEGTGLLMTYTTPSAHTEHIRALGALGLGPNLLTKQP